MKEKIGGVMAVIMELDIAIGFQKMRINNDCWVDQTGEPQSSVDYELIPKFFCDYSVNHLYN